MNIEYQPTIYPFQKRERPEGYIPVIPPQEVLELALSEIKTDRIVAEYDYEFKEWFYNKPFDVIELDKVPPDTYAEHLYHVAHLIQDAIVLIQKQMGIQLNNDCNEGIEQYIKRLAHNLTGYTNNLPFVYFACSLIKTTEDRILNGIEMPQGSALVWVSLVRDELSSQNQKYTMRQEDV